MALTKQVLGESNLRKKIRALWEHLPAVACWHYEYGKIHLSWGPRKRRGHWILRTAFLSNKLCLSFHPSGAMLLHATGSAAPQATKSSQLHTGNWEGKFNPTATKLGWGTQGCSWVIKNNQLNSNNCKIIIQRKWRGVQVTDYTEEKHRNNISSFLWTAYKKKLFHTKC